MARRAADQRSDVGEEEARRGGRQARPGRSSSISDDPDAPPEGERMNRRRTNATELQRRLRQRIQRGQLLGEKSGKGSGKKKK